MIGGQYQFLPDLPFVPGKLPAGVVAGVGSAVKALKVGDRVLAMAEQGGFGEFVAVPESQCYRLPDKMPFVDAASMALVYDTSWFALRDRARYQHGDTVLVLGATGGVGLAAIQLAKAMGAKVLAGVSSWDKADIAREAGADTVIDLSRPNLNDDLRAQVHEVTNSRGADIILDPLGGDMFDAAIRALAWRGRLVVIGFAAGAHPDAQGELSAAEEHRGERAAGQRLSQAHAGPDGGVLLRFGLTRPARSSRRRPRSCRSPSSRPGSPTSATAARAAGSC